MDKKMNREVSKEYLSVVKIRIDKERGSTEDKREAETEKREKKRKSPKYNASQWSDRTVIKTVKEISKVFNVVKYAKDTSITMPEGKRKKVLSQLDDGLKSFTVENI